jgi:hypothetical protein
MRFHCDWSGDPKSYDREIEACGQEAEYRITTEPSGGGSDGHSCGRHVGVFGGWALGIANTLVAKAIQTLSEARLSIVMVGTADTVVTITRLDTAKRPLDTSGVQYAEPHGAHPV